MKSISLLKSYDVTKSEHEWVPPSHQVAGIDDDDMQEVCGKTLGVSTIQGSIHMKQSMSARHENVNSRLKIFGALTSKFQNSILIHRPYFMDIVNVTYIPPELEPLFDIELDQKIEL